ncbi:MAG TPA: MoaD/ThiS family protein [Streptosporangiaceae bacterium]|nr:MoaD/ThiS family protein [Streptosporangiaceae bacterium]
MVIVTLRYWAAAKEAAGVPDEKVEAVTLADALATAAEPNHRLRQVLARASFLVNGEPVGLRPHDSVVLPDDAVIEVLPPFAGG